MSAKKDREDDILEETLAKLDKEGAYSSVRADQDDWWFRCMIDLGEEGKITRDEVFAVAQDCKRKDDS